MTFPRGCTRQTVNAGLTVDLAAEFLEVSPRTVYRYLREGVLPALDVPSVRNLIVSRALATRKYKPRGRPFTREDGLAAIKRLRERQGMTSHDS